MARKPRAEMIEETRAKLIDAARRAFADNGYAGASMDELTASAGLTRGALYHHFGDKKGLLAAVVQQIDDEMNLRLRHPGCRRGPLERLPCLQPGLPGNGPGSGNPAHRPARCPGHPRQPQQRGQPTALPKLDDRATARTDGQRAGPPHRRRGPGLAAQRRAGGRRPAYRQRRTPAGEPGQGLPGPGRAARRPAHGVKSQWTTASEPAATRTPRCSRPSSAQPGKASACCPSWPGSPTPGSPGWTSIAA
ncbi:probable transcriptional regulator [Pseudomonas aeruginosa NCMG1179]|nr:probable transcriptional regulator [Pseudomonas aeruginosa NCMG1179]